MATLHQIPLITTMTAAQAAVRAIAKLKDEHDAWDVRSLQEYFPNA